MTMRDVFSMAVAELQASKLGGSQFLETYRAKKKFKELATPANLRVLLVEQLGELQEARKHHERAAFMLDCYKDRLNDLVKDVSYNGSTPSSPVAYLAEVNEIIDSFKKEQNENTRIYRHMQKGRY